MSASRIVPQPTPWPDRSSLSGVPPPEVCIGDARPGDADGSADPASTKRDARSADAGGEREPALAQVEAQAWGNANSAEESKSHLRIVPRRHATCEEGSAMVRRRVQTHNRRDRRR